MQLNLNGDKTIKAKPFLKWAGGKTQLINEIETRLPQDIKKTRKIKKYFEPFLGGGAVFFYLKCNYKMKKAYLYDINKELILVYQTVKNDYENLINELEYIEEKFIPLEHADRKDFYLNIRKKFNESLQEFEFEKYSDEFVTRASYTIFLNKTCFNGLFRVNKKGEFNVPMGKYKNPKICDHHNLQQCSDALKTAKIYNSSFKKSEELIDENSLVYLDPPYRPINKTSHFTSYSEHEFMDKEQKELAEYFERISKKANAILSNSDPKNEDESDNFFDDLYSNFRIDRVLAKRFINSNASKRGAINEIIVTNY